jgi:amino acid transporter
MAARLKRVFLGRTLSTHALEHQLLPKFLALPVFSSDPLSSVAYATEEMMLVLVAAGAEGLRLKLPIALAIGTLLAIVVTSYRQTVKAYPRGGGSYIVARENLGTMPGLVAAAAILSDYVLTVAVSVTAGTVAVTSAAPSLARHKVGLAIGFVVLLTLANLRGVREAGKVFAVPTYGFVVMVYLTLLVGFARCAAGCPLARTADLPLEPIAGLTIFLVLKAFSSGATALTGVEAIADGVQAFRRPQSKNAAETLALMGAISISMFIGITFLATALKVRVDQNIALTRSVLAQIGETVFGRGALFFILQGFTAGILVLAANTSYQDFPRLSAILARDRFMPSQFRNRGNKLVFSNGIVVLAGLAIILIWTFHANLSSLIQLYVVGVFTAFTLSQAGMVRRWRRLRGDRWRRSMLINGVGAAVTGVVLVIVIVTKFGHPPHPGAWIVLAAIPVQVGFFLAVHGHYELIGRELRSRRSSATQQAQNTYLLLLPDLDLASRDAVAYLRALRPHHVVPVYLGPPEDFPDVARRWRTVAPRLGDIQQLPGAQHGTVRAVRALVRTLRQGQDDFVTVVIPEVVTSRSVLRLLLPGSLFWLKASLLFEPGAVTCNVPLLPEERSKVTERMGRERALEPSKNVVLIPVGAVHDATVRAVVYAKSIHATSIEGLFFASEPEEGQPIAEEWIERGLDVPLAVVDAPFRDITAPLLREIRKYTAHGDTVVTVVLPEFVVRRWWEHLLHGQTGLFIKRLLLFEPSVVVMSVPYRV